VKRCGPNCAELAGKGIDPDLVLPAVAGTPFYNTSRYTLATLGSTSTRANLEEYLSRFSANARQIFDHFGFDGWLVKHSEATVVPYAHAQRSGDEAAERRGDARAVSRCGLRDAEEAGCIRDVRRRDAMTALKVNLNDLLPDA
jgi:hypothetical protein